jgi:tetratricopeptide (TPR) repeat protein
MKKSPIILALCLLLTLACKQSDRRKPAVILPVTEHSGKPEQARIPYYHGLVEEYRAVLAEDPNNLAALIALGNAYSDNGEWRKAITIYQHALTQDERNADVHTDMGTAYRNLGMTEQALAQYRLALHYEPGHLDARYHIGIVYAYIKKDPHAAIHIWRELLKMAPNFPRAEQIRMSIAALHEEAPTGER